VTAMVMFSGLVCVGMLTALGRVTGTVLVMTGMVIRKMMRRPSMTSTSGGVLMVAIAPPDSCPTLIAMIGYSSMRLVRLTERTQGAPPGPLRRHERQYRYLLTGAALAAAGRTPPTAASV